MLHRLKLGWRALRQHSKLMLIASLLVFFPVLFIFTFQQFVNTSANNINTVTTEQISSFQDSLQHLLLINADIDTYIETTIAKQSTITEIRIVDNINNDLIIIHDQDVSQIGKIETDSSRYKTALINSGESFIFKDVIDGREIAQAFRAIEIEGQTTKYFFTEHDFTKLNSLINTRVQQTYLILTFIFLFLIALAYWIAKQINFQNRYERSLEKLHERDLFINSLAHELRAPLTAIRGYSSLIEESREISETEKNYAKKIKTATIRLVTLVNDFLEASRIQAGVLKTKRKVINPNQLINKVLEQLRPTALSKSLKIENVVPDNIEDIYTDPDRLQQILINIVSNSIKYTKSGTIKISYEEFKHHVKFVIADTGHGISAEDQKRLFNPFIRVGSADDDSTTVGSGLGMWITKKLVEQLDGTISLESIKGVGTHVIIKLKKHEET